jgi:UDP-N-acetylglucosamine:LPS N-acetylglucosamine transferase
MKKRKRICLECAEGGHLDEILEIMPAFVGYDLFFITARAPTTKRLESLYRVHYITDSDPTPSSMLHIIARDMMMTLVIAARVIRIMLREKPFIVVTTGGTATVQLCILARLLGVKVLSLQSVTRVTELSLTGKLTYPFANVFLVQWRQLLEKYPRAQYWGRVL